MKLRSDRSCVDHADVVSLLMFALLLLTGCATHRVQSVESLVPLNADNWTPYGGEWHIKDRDISNNSTGRGDKLVDQGIEAGNFSFDADLTVNGLFGEAGVIFRSSDEQPGVDSYHGYFAGVRTIDRSAELVKSDFGSSILAQAPIALHPGPLPPLHIHVSAMGCHLLVIITPKNGNETRLASNQEGCIATGHFGFRSSGTASWSDVSLRPLIAFSEIPTDTTLGYREPHLSLPDAPLLQSPQEYVNNIEPDVAKHALPSGLEKIGSFRLEPGRHPNVTLIGTVISGAPFVVIEDGTGTLVLPNSHLDNLIKPGDVVEAKGTLVSRNLTVSMENMQLRVLWSDPPTPPLDVSALQLTNGQYRARSVAIQGILSSKSRTSEHCELILRDQSQTFRAVVPPSGLREDCNYEIGARLRLRGVATSNSVYTQNIYPFAVIATQVDILNSPPWWSARHIVMLLGFLFVLVMFLQWGVYKFQQWHLQTVLHEREEIAFDMHDTLAQSFTGIAYQLEAANMETGGPQAIHDRIRATLQIVKLSHREASNTIAALRPQNRDAHSILVTLRDAAERICCGRRVRITTELTGSAVSLPVHVTDAFFRIGQEAIVNALRHSHCSHLTLSIDFSKRDVCLAVTDDGQGFDEETVRAGLGLSGMRARAKKLGTKLELSPNRPTGTVVKVVCPVPIAAGFFVNLRRITRFTQLLDHSRKLFDQPVRGDSSQ